MLRWTGGSKARASFRQSSSSRNVGIDGGDGGVQMNRLRNCHRRPETTSHGLRSSQHPFPRGSNSNVGKDCTAMRQSERNVSSVASSSDSGGRRSSPSSAREGGVDCMALEWSLKAAATGASTSTSAPVSASTAEVTRPRHEGTEGWMTTSCSYNNPVVFLRTETTHNTQAHDNAARKECNNNHTVTEPSAAAILESGDLMMNVPYSGYGGPCVNDEASAEPVMCLPPFHVTESERDGGVFSDAAALVPPEGRYLCQLPDFAEEWELQERNCASPPLTEGEVYGNAPNISLGCCTPFTSPIRSPEHKQTSGWMDEPDTLLPNEEFSYGPIPEGYYYSGEYADSGMIACNAPDGFLRTTAALPREAVGWWAPNYPKGYSEVIQEEDVDASFFIPTIEESTAVKHQTAEATGAPLLPPPPARRSIMAWSPNSLPHDMNQDQFFPYAQTGDYSMQSGRGMMVGAVPLEPQGFHHYHHLGFHPSAQPPNAARGRGGGGVAAGRGRRRGQPLNLSGSVPSARFQAFQRRYSKR